MQGFLLQGQSHVLSRRPEVCQDTKAESSVSSSPLARGISGQGRTRGDLRNEGDSLPLEDEEVATGTAWGKRKKRKGHLWAVDSAAHCTTPGGAMPTKLPSTSENEERNEQRWKGVWETGVVM